MLSTSLDEASDDYEPNGKERQITAAAQRSPKSMDFSHDPSDEDLADFSSGSSQSWFIPIENPIDAKNQAGSQDDPHHLSHCGTCLKYRTFRKKSNQCRDGDIKQNVASGLFQFIRHQCTALGKEDQPRNITSNPPTSVNMEGSLATVTADSAVQKSWDHREDWNPENKCCTTRKRPNSFHSTSTHAISQKNQTSDYSLLIKRISEQDQQISQIRTELSRMRELSWPPGTGEVRDSLEFPSKLVTSKEPDLSKIESILNKHDLILRRLTSNVDSICSDIRYMRMELGKVSMGTEEFSCHLSDRLKNMETVLTNSSLRHTQKISDKSSSPPNHMEVSSNVNLSNQHQSFANSLSNHNHHINSKRDEHSAIVRNSDFQSDQESCQTEMDQLLSRKRELESKMSKIPLRQQRDFEVLAEKLEVIERKLASQRITLQHSKPSYSSNFFGT